MSYASTMTTPERSSQQWNVSAEIPTKIVEDDEDDIADRSEGEGVPQEPTVMSKHNLLHRASGARISAFGGAR